MVEAVELADKDKTIDVNDWETIEKFLDEQKANFRDFYVDGKLDVDAVKDYVSDFFEHRRPSKEIQFVIGKRTLGVNFYLERSGSMVPYDSPNGDGSTATQQDGS